MPELRAMIEKQDKQTTYYTAVAEYLGGGVLWFLLSILALVGAIRMVSLKNYGLAMTSARFDRHPVRDAVLPAGSGGGHLGVGRVDE